jgi:hypothetical protein
LELTELAASMLPAASAAEFPYFTEMATEYAMRPDYSLRGAFLRL